jgi:hypothetical protein
MGVDPPKKSICEVDGGRLPIDFDLIPQKKSFL